MASFSFLYLFSRQIIIYSRKFYFVRINLFVLKLSILNRPGGEGGNGLPEGKFMKLGGKINFGVLSSKIDVIRAEKGAISLVLINKASFSC